MQATESSSPPQFQSQPSLADWLRLVQTPDVGLISAHRLLSVFSTPAAIFAAAQKGDARLDGLRASQRHALRRPPDGFERELDRVLSWCAMPNHAVLTPDHPAWPEPLRHIPRPPLLLYINGRLELLGQPGLAMVGSRSASTQGMANAARMAQAISEAGVTVVSGLALGIDAASHTGALRGAGSTIAVVGTGVDRSYPVRNHALTQQIIAEGCVVSEYGLGAPPLKENFPLRNRVIAGLVQGVLVVEAAAKSGSLITARLAAAYGRDVYAIPGSIHATLSKGCHTLIREGAKLVDQANDILGDFNKQGACYWRDEPDDSFVDRVLVAMGEHPISPDQLAFLLKEEAASLQGQLLALELAGLIERLPGGMFQRLHA